MVLGKFLTLTALLGSLSACGTSMYQESKSVTSSASANYGPVGDIFTLGYRIGKDQYYTLNESQKRKQTHAVYSALENDYGKEFYWYENDAKGVVKAVHGYPMGSGFCRVVYSMIEKRGAQRTFDETACKEAGHNGWRFITKH